MMKMMRKIAIAVPIVAAMADDVDKLLPST